MNGLLLSFAASLIYEAARKAQPRSKGTIVRRFGFGLARLRTEYSHDK